MKYLIDLRLLIVAGFMFLVIAIIDLAIQGKENDVDLQSINDLSAFGLICFVLFCICFAGFLLQLLIAVLKQILK